MSANCLPSLRCWNGTITDCTINEAVPALIKHYQLAKKESVDKVRIECTLKDASDKVIVTIREAVLGKSENFTDTFRLSEDLQNNGVITGPVNDGFKTKYHIKIKSADSASSNALIFLFMIALKQTNLIKHSQACIVTTFPEKDKERTIIAFNFDEGKIKIHLKKMEDERKSGK